MLVEGMADAVEGPNTWKSFSGALVRQAVGEAVSSLPPRQKQLIKLAYFGDLSNREIAQGLGITLSSVERGLRQAIASISEHLARGRAAGRRAIYALAMFLGGRWLGDARRAFNLGTVVLVAASAGAVLSAQPAAPAQATHVPPISVPRATAPQPQNPARPPAVEVDHALPAAPVVVVPPVTLPIQVEVPPLAVTATVHRLLGA